MFAGVVLFPKVYEILIEAKAISNRFYAAKKIVFIIPMFTLMIEDTFTKILKAIGKKLELQRWIILLFSISYTFYPPIISFLSLICQFASSFLFSFF